MTRCSFIVFHWTMANANTVYLPYAFNVKILPSTYTRTTWHHGRLGWYSYVKILVYTRALSGEHCWAEFHPHVLQVRFFFTFSNAYIDNNLVYERVQYYTKHTQATVQRLSTLSDGIRILRFIKTSGKPARHLCGHGKLKMQAHTNHAMTFMTV